MTKSIRIENSDLSSHPVRVTGQYKNAEGVWVDEASYTQLDLPTAMTTQFIYADRRIIVEERPDDPPKPYVPETQA